MELSLVTRPVLQYTMQSIAGLWQLSAPFEGESGLRKTVHGQNVVLKRYLNSLVLFFFLLVVVVMIVLVVGVDGVGIGYGGVGDCVLFPFISYIFKSSFYF